MGTQEQYDATIAALSERCEKLGEQVKRLETEKKRLHASTYEQNERLMSVMRVVRTWASVGSDDPSEELSRIVDKIDEELD